MPSHLATLPTKFLPHFEQATDRNALEKVESIINEIHLQHLTLANGFF